MCTRQRTLTLGWFENTRSVEELTNEEAEFKTRKDDEEALQASQQEAHEDDARNDD
ncbi:MAG: hypothetical protein Unbinned1446contig1001_30 [Prokaryotic dsDNA virus sp.]|nr:MAG: hypothetical protein Unbinned1446contig1001_30 [Prokaryotic dsDNA virus sp.]